jgi:hypothetical protein
MSNLSHLTFSDAFNMGGGLEMGGGTTLAATCPVQLGSSVPTSTPGSIVPTSMDSSLSKSLLSPPPDTDPPPITPAVYAPIKDKPSDMGIKDIVDKDSWTDAKKVINACLRRAPFSPGPSKSLITTANNAVASAWWEEVIVYHCKPPVLDLFVEESCFDGKGFKMIAYIDAHFNPSEAVDSLGYVFDMIDIKQAPEESVVTLKACFSRIFTSLKMGGISINASLQVGFMLRTLCSAYQAVVQEVCLGCHSLSTASLQTVVEQCVLYNKDPWKGPVGHDGKPVRNPLANMADLGEHGDLYERIMAQIFGYHMNCWHKGVVQ